MEQQVMVHILWLVKTEIQGCHGALRSLEPIFSCSLEVYMHIRIIELSLKTTRTKTYYTSWPSVANENISKNVILPHVYTQYNMCVYVYMPFF